MNSPWWQRLLAALALSGWFVLVYNGCNYLTSLRQDVGTCAFWWERYYPFIPALIIPYWTIDGLFFLAPFFCIRKFLLHQHCKRIFFGIVVSGLFFLTFPLTLAFTRPPIPDPYKPLFSSLENFNNFYNCAPSLHIVLRTNLWAIYVTPSRGWLRVVLAIWFALIGASTIFCWQHQVIDVITGQLLGLTCLWLFPSVPFTSPKIDVERQINANRKIGLRYTSGSVLCILLTWLGWPSSVMLIWPAISLAILALAYLGGGPSLLRKHQGRQLPNTHWLLIPYRWVAQWTADYFNRGQVPYGEIQPGLFIGRKLTQHEASRMPVKAVLDLMAEYDEVPAFLQLNYCNIPILDLTAPSPGQLNQAVDFLKENPNCYVHCSLGLGRTCAVAVAYLVSQGQSLEDALLGVQAVRPRVRLAEGTLAVLRDWAKQSNAQLQGL